MATEFDVNFKPTASPVAAQEQKYANINQGFSGAIAGQTKVPQLITQYDERFNVPQLQKSIQMGTEQYDALGNSIRAVPTNIKQGSQESILTQGQLGRMTNVQQQPLLEQQGILGQNLSRMGQNLATAQSNSARMVEAEQAQQAKELEPWLKQYDTESVLSAMRMTGWSTENTMELNRLLSNQQAGITLSEGEKNRLNQLAMQENSFANEVKMMNEAAKSPQYMSLGSNTTVIDPSTGRVVYKTGSAGGGGGAIPTNPNLNSSNKNTYPGGFIPLA